MSWIVQNLWLIPTLPAVAAGLAALLPQRRRGISATLAIGAISASLLLSLCAFAHALAAGGHGQIVRETVNLPWLQFGSEWLKLGWVLDPLTAVMLTMVTLASLLIFIYSVGYMAHDGNFTRFFCFLSLFAGAMLGLVIANSLLLLFICWELVGLTSYLLIGFWYHRPAAAAAAKKAFLTTRIGDLAFLLGMVWLYAQSGTLLFYDGGAGCLEPTSLARAVLQTTSLGLAASTGIGLLIFAGAVGKSGQVPLHVWLPDAMEGPTPVSALIHAATMVAAGVFLIARVYPLMSASATGGATTPALQAVTWVGAITAVFAASIAVAQNDIKRILAYSTVSQLGYMMMGLGVGGVAVGLFHLITHAFFKALLFLGAGSVIHGCHEEQDIRRMGGLRRWMPVTFAAYAAGMLALCGFPLFFSGFWSKDEILLAASRWQPSMAPLLLGVLGALLTAFYMTRQMYYVFFGSTRLGSEDRAPVPESRPRIHESPAIMTGPLVVLAVFAVLLGFAGTPAWPWFQSFLHGQPVRWEPAGFAEAGVLPLMLTSSLIVFAGLGLGWWFYGRKPLGDPEAPDPLERLQPGLFSVLRNKYFIDEIYGATVLRLRAWLSQFSAALDHWVWNGAVQFFSLLTLSLSFGSRSVDAHVVNAGFDEGCRGVSRSARLLSRLQNGQASSYLRVIGAALVALFILLMWSRKG